MAQKLFWLEISAFKKELITTAIESGVDAIVAPDDCMDKIKELALITTIGTKKGDMLLGKDVDMITITKKEDEKKVEKWQGKIPVIVKNGDWTIIPLENLISKTTNLIQSVQNAEEAQLALETMEKGADGICLETDDWKIIKDVAKVIQDRNNEKLDLLEVEIIETKQVGMGMRCCLDTCSMLEPGVGMLVGDGSSGMLLVYNENVESPYCDKRPFRVNAGAVHAYIRCPDNKTKYIGELSSGDHVLAVDPKGNTRPVIIGRNKIENRPLMLIKVKSGTKIFSLVMQNAETIRLTKKDGSPVSITHLKKGDKVLGFIEDAGRHFGVKVKETIKEQ